MNRNFITILMALHMAVFSLVLTSLSPLLGSMAQTFHLNLAASGSIFTLNFLGFVALIFIGGILAERLGKKRVLLWALIGNAAVLLLIPTVDTFSGFAPLIGLCGGFGGIIEALASAVAVETNEDRRPFALNFMQIFFGIGAVVGPLAAAALVSNQLDWRYFYLGCGILYGLLAAAVALTPMKLAPADHSFSTRDAVGFFKDRGFLFIVLCMTLYTGTEIGFWGWMSSFLEQSRHFESLQGSMAVAVFWSAMTLGRILISPLTARWRLSKIIGWLAVGSTLTIGGSLLFTGGTVLWLWTFIAGLCFSGMWPLILAAASLQQRSSSSLLFSVVVGCGGLGATALPLAMGVIASLVNTSAAMLIPLTCMILVASIFLIRFRKCDL